MPGIEPGSSHLQGKQLLTELSQPLRGRQGPWKAGEMAQGLQFSPGLEGSRAERELAGLGLAG